MTRRHDEAGAWTTVESPLGRLTLTGGTRGLSGLHFPGGAPALRDEHRRPELFGDVARQLARYFAGELDRFDVLLDLRGTAFQRRVWAETQRVGHGSTVTYGELAARVGRPDAVRAVAAANGRTPTPIIVPCHRVIGAGGALTGYAGGLRRKAALLALERHGPPAGEAGRIWNSEQMTML